MPEQKRSNIEEAYLEIKRLIFQQKLVPGQKLLYRELIDQLQMSKTPIINALNRLDQEGFIMSEPNCGYYVKPIDPKEVLDSHEVREALETKAVELAIKRAKPSDIKVLSEKLNTHKSYQPYKYDRKKFMLNAGFHLEIANISENRVLRYLLKRNLEHIILRAGIDNYLPDRMAESAKDHKKILNSIKKEDIPGTVKLIKEHINKSRKEILKYLSHEEEEDFYSMEFFE